jgi:hydroxymethylpyrimidine pyrophosphatase-like HAD family hydrolase
VKRPSESDIKLLIFDFDGTALGGHTPYAQFPPVFVRFLDNLATQGIRWATNTAWSLSAQFAAIRRSQVQSEPWFLVGGSGSTIGTIENGSLERDMQYDRMIKEKNRHFRKQNWPLICQTLSELLSDSLMTTFAFDFSITRENRHLISFSCDSENLDAIWRLLDPLVMVFSPSIL